MNRRLTNKYMNTLIGATVIEIKRSIWIFKKPISLDIDPRGGSDLIGYNMKTNKEAACYIREGKWSEEMLQIYIKRIYKALE